VQQKDLVQQKLEQLPARPGCYLFKGADGQVLYVGKARSLRSRVRSYFQLGSSDERASVPFLRGMVTDLETVVTASEKEATILENSLIKEHKPRFNIKLRDDKEYLSVRLDPAVAWPRLELVRRPKPDRARYFGPYHSAKAARRTLHLVEKHFQLRTCTDRELHSRTRPCLQYQIKRCLAPCVMPVSEEAYAAQVSAVSLFLDARHDELSHWLEQRMDQASHSLEFELAARYRDQLRAVHAVRETQRVVTVSKLDQDVLGLYREGDLVELSVLYIRRGRVIEAGSISHARSELPDDELVAGFLRDHYGDEGSATPPDEILLPVLPEGQAGIEEWLGERRVSKASTLQLNKKVPARCRLVLAVRGARRQLLDLARDNAKHAFSEKRRANEDMQARLGKLQERLRLSVLPSVIECCDISHLGGQDSYGSVVRLRDGVPDKRGYKSYRVRRAAPGDDYAAMHEVLSRRFGRGQAASKPGASKNEQWELPDLFVVDGGRGQLAVALAAASDLGLHTLPLVGLAKERENVQGDKLVDRVYLPGQKNPLPLKPNSPELFLLAHARDEAHRFANSLRKKSGKRRNFSSPLDEVPGIGPKTKKALLRAFGSFAQVLAASDEQLLAVPGVNPRQVAALRQRSEPVPPGAT
jgi:excinuclease ABC subunit C